MDDTTADQAIVLGASMAGLLAARVLSERYKRVVVIERDALPSAGEHRRGVPHGRHIHALHPRGLEILDELFPGFSASAAASGAVLCDILGDTRWQLSGYQLLQARTGLPALYSSRPFLEGQVRARARQLPGVRFLEGSSASPVRHRREPPHPDPRRHLRRLSAYRSGGFRGVHRHAADCRHRGGGRRSRTAGRASAI